MFPFHSSHSSCREHAGRRFMRRMGGHGFRHFASAAGSALGDAGVGGASFKINRMLSAADLQLIVLALLEEKPRHGYEIIKGLEERSSGLYAPSPGVIYPALTYLEEIGHASVAVDGTKKLYSLTEAGAAHLAANREAAAAMLAELARIGRRAARVRNFFAEEAADDDDPRSLRAARQALRAALSEKLAAAPGEAELRRIVEVLDRAAREIRGQ